MKLPAGAGRSYDVARDGRFLISVPETVEGKLTVQTQFVVVQNWFEELRARVPRQERIDESWNSCCNC